MTTYPIILILGYFPHADQRVLYNLIEDQAFRRRMIWFLSGFPPTPPPLPSVSSTSESHRKTEKKRQLSDWRGGKGWARSRILRPQESLVLYKSFNTLWFVQSTHLTIEKALRAESCRFHEVRGIHVDRVEAAYDEGTLRDNLLAYTKYIYLKKLCTLGYNEFAFF
jgi:hypothetical protein